MGYVRTRKSFLGLGLSSAHWLKEEEEEEARSIIESLPPPA